MPDAKTILLFREHLMQEKAVENLFARFDKHLTRAGYPAMGGQILGSSPKTDATIVAAPKQRNTNAEKTGIKRARFRTHGRTSRRSNAGRIGSPAGR